MLAKGAAFSVLSLIEANTGDTGDCLNEEASVPSDLNGVALQRYILHCAQQTEGGLRGVLCYAAYVVVGYMIIVVWIILLKCRQAWKKSRFLP